MKSIAFVSELYGAPKQGGENKAMYRTFMALRRLGYKIDFFSYSGDGGKKLKTSIPIKYLSLPFIRESKQLKLNGSMEV
jgi:hypothetical protein